MHYISPVLWQFLLKWFTDFAVFPPEASAIAPRTDTFFLVLTAISLVFLLIIVAMIVGFSVRYRKSRNPVATQIEGSVPLEATWTIIPLGLFMIFFVWGALLYLRIYSPPPNAMNVYIVGKQWMWKAEHPGGQHEINTLHVPINKPVQLTMISQDVFHSFSIPAFRIKREVIPGRYTTVWFEATKPGSYHLFCSQYCGTDHSAMIGQVIAMPPDDYQAWLAGSTSGASLAQNGERLFAVLGCNMCHTGMESARGPNLAGIYGKKIQLNDGSTVTVNDAYIRTKILNPSLQVPTGFVPIMPTYQGQVSEEGLIELVEFIKSLNSNERIQQTRTTTGLIPAGSGGPGGAAAPAAGGKATEPGKGHSSRTAAQAPGAEKQ